MAQVIRETGAWTERTHFGVQKRKCHVSVAEKFLLLDNDPQGKALLSENNS